MKKLKYIVTGTGRCGSVFLARFLTSVGIPCGHESVFDYRGLDFAMAKLAGAIPIVTSECSRIRFKDELFYPEPNWLDNTQIIAESSYMAAPFLGHKCLADSRFIHIVRHPVKVINSFCNYLAYFKEKQPTRWEPAKKYETFIFKHIPELHSEMTQFERCALFYVRWNEMIENNLNGKEYLFHKIEDSNDKLFDYLNLPKTICFDDREINSYKKPIESFTLDKLPEGKVKDLLVKIGQRYGYKMNSEYLVV